eukprot:7710459-Ditylum_brightwellii.AAC.1
MWGAIEVQQVCCECKEEVTSYAAIGSWHDQDNSICVVHAEALLGEDVVVSLVLSLHSLAYKHQHKLVYSASP